jgi:hypothetical protein
LQVDDFDEQRPATPTVEWGMVPTTVLSGEQSCKPLRRAATAVFATTLLAGLAAVPTVAGPPAPKPATKAFGVKATSSVTRKVDFVRDIRPILEQRCTGCHGGSSTLSNLDLTSRKGALAGGNRGPALVPGNASKSHLFRFAAGLDRPTMPPQGALPSAESELIRKWIDQGAPWPGTQVSATGATPRWWSLEPVKRIPGGSIDGFVGAKLKASGLGFAPPADRRTLIRRVTFDLTGLPPTPEDVDMFLADTKPGAYERVVDRLLASPHYGEAWGRHWLDLARYADSGGFEGDKDRPLMWKYRDWVIRSFNTDLPFNRFVSLQLAGDELAPSDNDAWIATGFLACGTQDIVEMNARTRANEVDDLVSTTGASLLGITLACARCHDHKTDPIRQTDYYRLAAVFTPTARKEVDIPTPEERQRKIEKDHEIDPVVAPLKAEAAPLRERGITLAKAAGNPNPTPEQAFAALSDVERSRLAELDRQVNALEAGRIALPKAQAVTDSGPNPAPSHLHRRGDAYLLGPVVEPGFVAILPGGNETVSKPVAGATTSGRRSALARWITRPDNPLTARVWMNRIWMHHFGNGICDTPSNVGTNGDLPSHPELLDWLAARFVDGGWKLKPLHREIVLSRTYRQSSVANPAARAVDPRNRLLSSFPLRRLGGEAIRDSILAVAGSLDKTIGGPPVHPPVDPTLRADTFQGMNWPDAKDTPDTWRRSVYVKVKRSLLLPQLEVFDCPEITFAVAKRNVTTTPLQALHLLNDPVVRRQGQRFAKRLEAEVPGSPAGQVERAWRLALGRRPSAKERATAVEFLRNRPLADLCHALFNLNEFVYVP